MKAIAEDNPSSFIDDIAKSERALKIPKHVNKFVDLSIKSLKGIPILFLSISLDSEVIYFMNELLFLSD